MALSRDFAAFFDDDSLEYPGVRSRKYPDGKTYTVAAPDARTGLWLAGLADTASTLVAGGTLTDADRERLKLDDDSEKHLYERVLGATFQEMVDDDVSWPVLKRIGRDAYLIFALDQSAADAQLPGGQGEAPAPTTGAKTGPAASPKGGSSSRRASGGTPARTRARASTRSSKTSDRTAKTG